MSYNCAMSYALAALVIVVVFVLLTASRPDVTPAKARGLVAHGARLIDVRTDAEFASGHIDGAENIPVSDVPGWGAKIDDKDKPVVLYCASGLRSGKAVKELRRQGFTAVHNLGSIRNWEA